MSRRPTQTLVRILVLLLALPWSALAQNGAGNGGESGADVLPPSRAAGTEQEATEPEGEASEPKIADPSLPHDWMDALRWRSIGPSNMGGRITDIAVFEKDPSIWWAATASGGLLKTENNGVTFEHQFDQESTVSIGDVTVAQSDPSIVWVGTGESNPRNSVSWGDGVYKSTDGGATWQNMGLEKTFQIGRIVIHPSDPNVVYVGALGRLWGPNEDRGLFKTTDGGETWEKILYVDDKTGVIDVQMSPGDPDTLLVATYERQRDGFDSNDPAKKWGPGSGLYKTDDAGKSFRRISDGLPPVDLGRIGIDFYRGDPDVVYALIESSRIGEEPENAAFMGVQGENVEVGARLTEITEGGPAAAAGIEKGDIVVGVDGETVHSWGDLQAKIRRHLAGDTVAIELSRDRKSETIEVTFANRPGEEEDEEVGEEEGGEKKGEGEKEKKEPEIPTPFRTRLGGQVANVQDQQGPDGSHYGGVYKSTDGGESWTRINSVNPRPMYFSQIRVDPSDDQHLYVLGISLYRSKDGGETFTGDGGRGGVHVDHHALWVDPTDGRHIILGNDGGMYVTHDRMERWDHLNHVAIGQFYHVTVGPRRNYWVYGGLQDNGSWGAPNRVRHGSGPTNDDWISVGGGDGFICLVDPDDPDQIYYESQNGALGRRNLATGERGFLRPRAPRGKTYRWNWKTPFILSNHNNDIYYTAGNYVFRSWFQGEELDAISPEITRTEKGSASALTESPRDADVMYVGTTDGMLWMSKDGGGAWHDLYQVVADEPESDDESSGGEVAEATVTATTEDRISGRWKATSTSERMPDLNGEFTFDFKLGKEGRVTGAVESDRGDGEVTDGEFDTDKGELAFSLERGPMRLDFVGALDSETEELKGKIEIGGGFDMDFSARRTGDAEMAAADDEEDPEGRPRPFAELVDQPVWVSSIEASRAESGRVYVTLDGHRSNDDRPHVLVSEDFGRNWRSLTANLPSTTGVARVVREDLENPDVLYLGTEFRAWVSIDRGATWTRLNSNLPTVAIHEIAQHPTAGEIVAGTHGRSLWVLDVTPLRQMTPEKVESEAELYRPNTAIFWRREPARGRTLRRFVGDNPSAGAEIVYSLAKPARRVRLKVEDASGETVQELDAPTEAGLHRVRWDLRGASASGGGRRTPRVAPGEYQVALTVGNETQRQPLLVTGDPDFPDARLWGEEYDLEQLMIELYEGEEGGEEETGSRDV